MHFRPHPRAERGLLLVPVLPGSMLRSVEPADSPPAASMPSRSLLMGVVVAGAPALLITTGVLLFARGSGSGAKHVSTVAVSAPAPVTQAVSTPPIHASLRPPPTHGQDHARAAALRLAARLPVRLESTALLRVGSSVYAVGGTTRSGTPSDGIWQLHLRTGRVTSVGRFVEPLTGAAAAARGGVLYLAGGWTGEKLATGVLRWSPGQSSSLVTRLPVALRDGSAAFVGGRLYVAGGSPQQVFEIDVDSGSLTVRTTPPGPLRAKASNLDYLIRLSRATSSR